MGQSIGCGGFGEVFEATRVEDGWKCAVKRLFAAASEDDKKRFHREVRMQAPLRHPNIVPIIEHNLSDNPPWLVMPLASTSLRRYLGDYHGESELWIIHQVAEGLDFAHTNKVIHRDSKPENVLLFLDMDKDLYATIGDFGLGRFFTRDSPSLTQTNIRMGTVEYMAPEQYVDAKRATHSADIYALGKLLYEVLTGEIPYPDMDFTKVPRKYVYLIQKACRRNPEERYRNIKEFLNDLKTITHEEQLLTKPAEMIQSEVQRILEDQDFTRPRVEKLAKLLMNNTDDNVVLMEILPKLPDPILQCLMENHSSSMDTILNTYDEAVSGALPFEYCDVVANFYERIFYWTRSDEVKRMILKRLPFLGQAHSRWHVGNVFARIVSRIQDPSLCLAVKDILESNEEVSTWCKFWLEKHSLPTVLKNIVKTEPALSS